MKRTVAFCYWAQAASQSNKIARWLHLPQLSSEALRESTKPPVTGLAFRNRLSSKGNLDSSPSALRNQFADISNVSAVWPIGERFFEFSENPNILKHLILPNPDNERVIYYFHRIKKDNAGDLIKMTTVRARQLGIEIKWIDWFVLNSMTLADSQKPTGWAHVESVMPSRSRKRRGYFFSNDSAPDQIKILNELFWRMWSDAKVPPQL
jgi:hypothetical protein